MAEAVLEQRVRIEIEENGLSFTCSIESAEELRDYLVDILPVSEGKRQFGFGTFVTERDEDDD